MFYGCMDWPLFFKFYGCSVCTSEAAHERGTAGKTGWDGLSLLTILHESSCTKVGTWHKHKGS